MGQTAGKDTKVTLPDTRLEAPVKHLTSGWGVARIMCTSGQTKCLQLRQEANQAARITWTLRKKCCYN